MGNKKWIFTTTGNDQLSRVGPRSSSKALPNAKFAHKKIGQGPLWAAALLIHYRFLILVKLFHLRSILSRLMRCTENCNA